MPMRWDPLLAAAAARELDSALRGSRVRALLADPRSRRVALFLRSGTLVFELHPLAGWLSLLPASEPPADSRSMAHAVEGVEAPPDESLLVFRLRRVRGRAQGLDLNVELIGNRWNAVVVERSGGVIRHVLVPRVDRQRTLEVGALYRRPPPTGREGVDRALDETAWQTLVGGGAPDGGTLDVPTRRTRVLRRIAWTSSLNVDVLLGLKGWREWRRITDPASWGGFLLESDTGFQPYPVALSDLAEAFPTLLDAFQAARRRDPDVGPASALLLSPRLLERARGRLERAQKRVAALKREIAQAEDPAPVRALGDLILARLRDIPRGAENVTLAGFDGADVVVELDPALSPSENARRYYDRAGRLERALATLPEKIERAESDERMWRERIDAVIEEKLSPEVLAAALGPGSTAGRSRTRGAGSSLPYRSYRSSGGLEIRVGRGAKQNDALTFHHAAPTDIWLHTRQSPGAHVILRWTGEDRPPRRDLAEAANLAALHSAARHAGSVPVAWTRRKYVRKPRGAGPGSVAPERVETVFVTPDPTLLDRLRPEEGNDAL